MGEGTSAGRAIVAGALLSCFASPARAETREYAIQPQRLSSALRLFAAQSGKSVVFDIPSADELPSPGAVGSLSDGEALRRLLLSIGTYEIRKLRGGYVITAKHDGLSTRSGVRATPPPVHRPHVNQLVTGSEIVVTAQKRSERLLDAPISISVLTRGALLASGISSAKNLEQLTPGLLVTSVGLAFTPTVRGITTVSTSPGDETNVALYIDDVYVGAPIAGLIDIKDIERIEVSKGPQSTLYGRNATGGAIRVVTRSPSRTPSAEISADYGTMAHRIKLFGFATGPISNALAASLSLNYTKDDGYIAGAAQNTGMRFGKFLNYAGRAKLRYEPKSDISVVVSADASWRHDTSIYAWVPRDGRNAYASVPGAVIVGPYNYAGSTLPIADLKNWGLTLQIERSRPEGLSIKAITGFRSAYGFYQTDTDRVNLPISALQLRQNQRNFSEELLFITPAARLLNAVGGFYYYHSRAWNPYFSAYMGDAPGGTKTTEFTNNVVTDSLAIFGEATLNLTDRLHLTAGARYTLERKSGSFRFLIRSTGLVSDSIERTYRIPTFRAAIRYNLTPDVNVYASISNGFKSGVFNAYAYPLAAVQPEKIGAIEAGIKGAIGDFQFSLSSFFYNYRDIQVQGQTQVDGVFDVTLRNAARARIRGFEANLSGKADAHLSFDLGVSALPVAKYTTFPEAYVFAPDPNGGGNLQLSSFNAAGSRTICSPKWQLNARLVYSHTLIRGTFGASINYTYNDGFYFQPGNLSRQRPYHLVNGRIAWTEPSGRFTLSVTGENLLNQVYSFYTTDSVAGTVDALARPREINFGISAHF